MFMRFDILCILEFDGCIGFWGGKEEMRVIFRELVEGGDWSGRSDIVDSVWVCEVNVIGWLCGVNFWSCLVSDVVG